MFCFNEFAFTVQVKHKINSKQILGFILICLYFTTGHFHICVLTKNVAYFPFNYWLSFQRLTALSFMGIKILLLGFNMQIEEIKLKDYQKRS